MFDREGLDVGFVELVFLDEPEDQFLLLVGTFPCGAALPVGHQGDVGGTNPVWSICSSTVDWRR
jgi:hypothetical protein